MTSQQDRDDYGRDAGCTCPVVRGLPWKPPRVVLSPRCALEHHRITAAENLARIQQANSRTRTTRKKTHG